MSITPETVLNIVAFICGLFSVFFSLKAKNKLTTGILKKYVAWITMGMYALFLAVLWRALREAFELDVLIGNFITYPEYILTSIAFIYFAVATNKILVMADLYGFDDQKKKIKQAMEKKKAKTDETKED